MKKSDKGNFAELKIALICAERGWNFSKPYFTARYDCIIDDGKKLYRTQVKYADADGSNAEGTVICYANNGPNSPAYYTTDEIDLLLVYVPKLDKIVQFLPHEFDQKTIFTIRLAPTKNGQKKGLFLAEEHLW